MAKLEIYQRAKPDNPCPSCGRQLTAVPPSPHLNADQWESVKAGDYFCEACPASAGTAGKSSTGFAYFNQDHLDALRASSEAKNVIATFGTIERLAQAYVDLERMLTALRNDVDRLTREAVRERDAALARAEKAERERDRERRKRAKGSEYIEIMRDIMEDHGFCHPTLRESIEAALGKLKESRAEVERLRRLTDEG